MTSTQTKTVCCIKQGPHGDATMIEICHNAQKNRDTTASKQYHEPKPLQLYKATHLAKW